MPSPEHKRPRPTTDDDAMTMPPARSLADLPDAAAATLAAFLDADAARAVVLSGRHAPPLFMEAFQRRYTLRIPPDAARNARLVQLIQAHARATDSPGQDPSPPPPPPVLATHFTVADMDVAASILVPVGHHVHGLAVSADAYTAWPVRPFRWDVLALMPALVRLELDRVWDEPIDLSALAASAPRLQELVITRASKVTQALGDLPLLRALHLEDTNIHSFAIAVGLPRLQSLTLLTSPEGHSAFGDIASLALVAPLTRLVVRGRWETCPRAAVNAHAATLREYSELDRTLPSYIPWNPKCPDWASLRHLQTLRIGRYKQTDIQPLAALVSLEHLQLVMSDRATHCRPLRHLKRLRELQLSNGWLCDLVGYLPRLEKLVWEEDSLMYNNNRHFLWRRVGSDIHDGNDEASVRCSSNNEGVGVAMGLRHLVLRGAVAINDCPVVYAMLEHVEHLEVHRHHHRYFGALLRWIADLRHLKRLLFRNFNPQWVEGVLERKYSFACAESLEELYFSPWHRAGEKMHRAVPFPRWFFDHLPNLRVLASPLHESIIELASLCPRLTHLHLPFSVKCEFPLASRESLSRLCVLSLAIEYDCAWLRAECGEGRGLPSLRQIFHPTTDCLSSSECRRHELVECQGNVERFVAERVLVPSWTHKWVEIASGCKVVKYAAAASLNKYGSG